MLSSNHIYHDEGEIMNRRNPYAQTRAWLYLFVLVGALLLLTYLTA